MAINIDFLADVKDVIKGTDNVADALDDVGDDLENLGKSSERGADQAGDALKGLADDADTLRKDVEDASERAGESIGDSFDEGTKEARREVESFEDQAAAAFKSIAADAKAAGDKVGKSQRDGFEQASDGAREFRDEADSTAREAAASFDGSADSIIETFQEVSANAFAGFGPAGAAAGLAAAIGIGVAVTKLQEAAEENDELKTAVGELAQEFYDAGGALDAAQLKEKVEEIAFSLAKEDIWWKWGDQARTGAEMVMEALDGISGVDARKVLEGLAGDVESGQEAFDGLTRSIERDEEALESMTTITAKGVSVLSEEGEELKKSIQRREELRDKISEATGASKDAAAATEFFTETMGESTESIQERIEAEAELKDANLSAAESEIKLAESTDTLTKTLAENGNTLNINTEAGRNNRSAILDHVDAINASTTSQLESGKSIAHVTGNLREERAALLDQIGPFFKSRDAAKAYIDQVLKTPREAKTDVSLTGTAAAEQNLNHLARNRSTIIDVRADTSAADYAIAQLNGRSVKVHADFVPRGGQKVVN